MDFSYGAFIFPEVNDGSGCMQADQMFSTRCLLMHNTGAFALYIWAATVLRWDVELDNTQEEALLQGQLNV